MSDRLELKPSDRGEGIPREIFQEESTNSLDVDIAGLSGRNSQAEKESYLAHADPRGLLSRLKTG